MANFLDNKLREDLERMKKIRAHRGLRHYWGLRVRGQHIKTTGCRGRTVGDSTTGVNQYYVEPALYSWFYKLRQAILSKLTVFFYNVLKEYHNEESMKEFCSRLHNDIPGK